MTSFLALNALLQEGVPNKAIARRLGIDVRTVRKYRRRIKAGDTEPRCQRPPGKLEPHRERIAAKVEQGLSAIQIHLDLGRELPDLDVSIGTVGRLVRRLRKVEPKVYKRMSFRPGEEAQIDFGEVGRLMIGGKLRKAYLFVMTLCYSRYSYYELVLDQRVPTFLGAIRRAFEDFGGVPERIKPDNLKSAVLINALNERYYQEDFFRFCQHYGTQPDAARPRTPTDKGRVERDIRYAKGSCFHGRKPGDFGQAQAMLKEWRNEVALVRVHGTTRRRPIDMMEEERAALRPLPEEGYELATWGQYKVRKDSHINLEANFYSVPSELVGRSVLVRTDEEELTVFAEGGEVARHRRSYGMGETVTKLEHYPPEKRPGTQEIHRRRVEALRECGPRTCEYLSALKKGRWVFGSQVGQLHRLLEGHGAAALERACARALHFEALDGAQILTRILERGLHNKALPGETKTQQGPPRLVYARSLADYEALLEDRRAS